MTTIHIGIVNVYVERDKEGYINLSTDGYTGDILNDVIAALRGLQTDDDREMDEIAAASRISRMHRGGPL
jgi:hypothetical protein